MTYGSVFIVSLLTGLAIGYLSCGGYPIIDTLLKIAVLSWTIGNSVYIFSKTKEWHHVMLLCILSVLIFLISQTVGIALYPSLPSSFEDFLDRMWIAIYYGP